MPSVCCKAMAEKSLKGDFYAGFHTEVGGGGGGPGIFPPPPQDFEIQYDVIIIIGERARHSQVCTIENRGYIIYYGTCNFSL